MKHFFANFSTVLATAILPAAELPDVIDFNDHVQPILSENCYHCHGPDSSTREPSKAHLRLDREEYAFLPRANGEPTIIKGDPDRSELIARIISKDPDEVMPTPKSHKKPLKDYEVAILKKWIKQGAPYEEHWSFIPPAKPAVPEGAWGVNAVDKFIGRKHLAKNLEANKPEEAGRLYRRLSFDITGLPPKPEDVDAFREAASKDLPAAVKAAVDQLVTTDGYAEHFARHWLDAARYADTHGIHIDNYRSIWPYRDWVIEAFRKNMPFDDFTIAQIAGDLLPNRTLEDQIATGFNRCLPTTGEGGAIAEEYESIYATERTETTSAVWLGLTTGCAACHDHKFDPISQKDFYTMTAFFRNTTMKAMDKNNASHPPNVFAPRPDDRPRWNELSKKIAAVEKSIKARRKDAEKDYHQWMTAQGTTPIEDAINDPDVFLPLAVTDGKISGTVNGEEKTWEFKGSTKSTKDYGDITRVSGINVDLGNTAIFDARDQVTFGGYLFVDGNSTGPIISRMNESNAHRGWDLWLEGGRLASHIVDSWPAKAIKAATKSPLPRKRWHHIMVTYDGTAAPEKSLTIYVNGKAQSIKYSQKGPVGSILTDAPTRLGARHPDNRLKGQAFLHSFQFYKRKLTPSEVQIAAKKTNINQLLAIEIDQRNKQQNGAIFDYYINKIDQPTKELITQKRPLVAAQNKLRSKGAVTLVMEEKKGEAFAHILERGEYNLKEEKVAAAIPELFQEPGDDKPKNRLDLAKWLVSEKNPLTARVTVNRIWYYFFGRGLVETTEDFGIMGGRPSHPELLDYLAVEFMENDWDMHHIIRLITNSATYQQSGLVTSANREKDPTNILLWRTPRHRLEAEQLRDMSLAASGLLVDRIGGPPVKPYQPKGIWEAVAMKQSNTRHYKEDRGQGLYRRSIYTFLKRSAAPPNMEILNAPTREVFCVRRDRTNTPLQAFVTLNDTQFIEAARALATHALKEQQGFVDRLAHITRAFMGRSFDIEEQETVKKALTHHLKRYEESPDLAGKLITVGNSKPDTSIPKHELAAWTLIASQIFNLDETLTK